MAQLLLVGVGAGLVSALLFAVVTAGSALALVLSYIAPLPVLIAALGWHHRAGLVAAAAGASAIALLVSPATAVVFALGVAGPGWWLAYLALLGRAESGGQMEWYPLGNLVLWLVGLAAVITLAGAFTFGGSYASYLDTMRRAIGEFIRMETGASDRSAPLPGGIAQDGVIDLIIAALPPLAASSFVLMFALNLWLAAKVVAISGRLPRPWPAIDATAMPRFALAGFAASAIVAIFASGFPGVLAKALTGAFVSAYTLQGLAAVHFLTRGKPWRVAALSFLYLLLAIFLIWIAPLVALAGVADAIARPRMRRPRASGDRAS